jgi:hypothetical protein
LVSAALIAPFAIQAFNVFVWDFSDVSSYLIIETPRWAAWLTSFLSLTLFYFSPSILLFVYADLKPIVKYLSLALMIALYTPVLLFLGVIASCEWGVVCL